MTYKHHDYDYMDFTNCSVKYKYRMQPWLAREGNLKHTFANSLLVLGVGVVTALALSRPPAFVPRNSAAEQGVKALTDMLPLTCCSNIPNLFYIGLVIFPFCKQFMHSFIVACMMFRDGFQLYRVDSHFPWPRCQPPKPLKPQVVDLFAKKWKLRKLANANEHQCRPFPSTLRVSHLLMCHCFSCRRRAHLEGEHERGTTKNKMQSSSSQ